MTSTGEEAARVSAGLDAVDVVVGFAGVLRAAGLQTSPERVAAAVSALAGLEPTSRPDVYWATRVTLCSGPDEFERFDAAFWTFFGTRSSWSPPRVRPLPRTRTVLVEPDAPSDDNRSGNVEQSRSGASAIELLRHRDVRALTPTEREEVRRLVAALRLPPPPRRTRRNRPAGAGPIHPGRTVRASLATAGEPARLHRAAPATKPRRLVLLVDVSGSMEPYADVLLRFAHAASRAGTSPTEVFTLGTRLTRVTRELSARTPDVAMAAVADAVADAGGGTRLGEMLKEFLDHWGQRGTARGAIVVVLSDGWERGDPTILGEQMARLHRLAHRVIWANPRKGAADYSPVAGGMAAALPSIDAFVAGHSLAAFEHLAAVIAEARAGDHPPATPSGRPPT